MLIDLHPRSGAAQFAAQRLADDGYVLIRGAAEVSQISAIAADFAPRFDATPFCSGGFYGERTKRFGRLLIRSPHMANLVLHPGILALAEAVLGPWCERIQLNLTQAIELHPGALAQFPHRDQDLWQGSLGEVEYLLNVMWPLNAFTEENGATMIWPASHGVEALVEQPREKPIVAAAEPGDAIVFLGSTLHGAGANRSAGARRGIIVSYCLGWLKPYENPWLSYPPDIARHFPPELAALAGYSQHRPNLGNFEGQCPSVLFGGYPDAPLAATDALRPDQEALLGEFVAGQHDHGEGADAR